MYDDDTRVKRSFHLNTRLESKNQKREIELSFLHENSYEGAPDQVDPFLQ